MATVANAFRLLGGKVQTYGVELSPARHAIAAGVLDACLSSAWEDVTIARQSISLLYLNPPYDTEAGEAGTRKRRLEYTFLQNTLKVLQDHALLVYIVPLKLLALPPIAKCLAGYFEQISVYALPPGEFEQFGQVVVFAYCKPVAQADEAETQRLMHLGASPNAVPGLETCTETFTVPPSLMADADFFLRKTTLSHAEVVDAITRAGVHTTHAWRDLTQATAEATFTPAVPLKIGHVSGLIASGQMGTVVLGDLLVKGRSVKVLDKVDEHGHVVADDSEKAVGERERFETRIFTLSPTGHFTTLEKADELQAFLTTHANAIAQVIAQRYRPLYNELTVQEWRTVSRLLPGKFLPGRKESGLLPAQKHVAIAASRSALHQGWADIVGEMGTGVR